MKTKHQKIIILSLILVVFFSFYSTTYAIDENYTVLAPLPGIGQGVGTTTTKLSTYLPAVFNLGIGIAAVLAFMMITFGGVMYATSDAITGKSQGREYIENAVWGLLLVIGAWAILYTINPQILTFSLDIPVPSAASSTPSAIVVTPMTAQEQADDAVIRARLLAKGITINKAMCANHGQPNCTNVNGLPIRAEAGLIELISKCACGVIVTGGTEDGHATHGVGRAIVDLSPTSNLTTYLKNNATIIGNTYTLKQTFGASYRFVTFVYEPLGGNPNGTSTGAHYHVVFN